MAPPTTPSVHVLDAHFLASAADQAQLPAPAFAEVAFGGRSNVGKSSLINRLLGRRKLVRTSSTPGATRGLSLFRSRLRLPSEEEAILDLVDLPGYGYAKRSKAERKSWGPMIETFLEQRVGLRGVVVIIDSRRGPEPDDEELLVYLDHLGIEAILVATKTDKLPVSQRKLAVQAVGKEIGRRAIGVSANTGDGVDRLWRRILRVAAIGAEAPG